MWRCLRVPMFSHFSRTPTCDRQTHGHGIYRKSIASAVIKLKVVVEHLAVIFMIKLFATQYSVHWFNTAGNTLTTKCWCAPTLQQWSEHVFVTLWQIWSVQHHLLRAALVTLICALVLSKIDYCNSVLPGASESLLRYFSVHHELSTVSSEADFSNI